MTKKDDIVRATANDVRAMLARESFGFDWAKIDGMTEEELEISIAADPDDIHEAVDWNSAVEGISQPREQIDLQVDADVLDWFRMSGQGYQRRMNRVLRAFMESRKRRSA